MDPVSLTIAFLPLALYLLLLAAINLGRRPRVLSGGEDAALLCMGLLGMVIVGPMNLFLPDAAATRFGPYVWWLLIAFYGLCVLLYLLVSRPRLVVFNVPLERLRETLVAVAARVDSSAVVTGDALVMPNLGMQLHLEPSTSMRTVTLVAIGDRQSLAGWSRLKRELRRELRSVEVSPNPRGFSFVAVGLLMLVWPIYQLVQMPRNLIAQQLVDMLRM